MLIHLCSVLAAAATPWETLEPGLELGTFPPPPPPLPMRPATTSSR